MPTVEQIHANAVRKVEPEKPRPQPTNVRRPVAAPERDENGNWFPSVSSAGAAAVRAKPLMSR